MEDIKIICFGDSLTRGVSVAKGRLRILKENYPAFLQQLFSESEGEAVSVINKGVFNDNSDSLLSRLDKDVIDQHPDYAIIEIGGNDCNFNWKEVVKSPGIKHAPIVPVERYIENIRTIVRKVQESGITPIISTLPPLDPVRYYKNVSDKYSDVVGHLIGSMGGIEHWHGIYNSNLNKLADELGVLKIDVRSAIKKSGNLTDLISDDGIHLTAAGYKVFSQDVYKNLINWSKKQELKQI